MAVSFLTAAQRARYGHYPEAVTPDDLARCFYLSDDDRAQIMSCRGHHNRLGFALQLSTVRYLGTFLDDPIAVPFSVLQFLSRQLAIQGYGNDSVQNGPFDSGRAAKGCKNNALWLPRPPRMSSAVTEQSDGPGQNPYTKRVVQRC